MLKRTKLKSKFISSLVVAALAIQFNFLGTNISVKAETLSNNAASINKVNYSEDVIYQIVTDRFFDGDKNNNPSGELYDSEKKSPKKYFGGDWKGIADKINDGYLTDMGITAIWISQPVENVYSVMADGSTAYHGYWARDFKKTNPAFGSNEDFKNLVDTAHSKNMKVVIDFAPNHTSPTADTKAEDGAIYDNGKFLASYNNDPNNLFYHNGGTDFKTTEDGIYRNLYDLADFNHQNPTVDSYFKEAIKKWLDMGIDGIRMDAVKHMPEGWQKSFVDSIYSYKPVFIFGEWFLGLGQIDGHNNKFANESGMSLLDFRFGQTVRNVFRTPDGSEGKGKMQDIENMIKTTAEDYKYINDQVTFLDNHDMDRFYKENESKKTVDNALVLTLTSRGVPAIYYGTEQYMTGKGDPYNRAMMTGFDKNTSAYNTIKKLAPLRKANPAIAYGETKQRWVNDDVYIYERQFGDNVALVAINRNENKSYDINGLNTALAQGQYKDVLENSLGGNNIEVNKDGSVNNFKLAPGAAAVWSYVAKNNDPKIAHVGQTMAKAGDTVVIDGRGFGSDKGTVYFGDKAANVVAWGDNQIKATVPNVEPGKLSVTVKMANGKVSNEFSDFNVLTGNQVTVRFVVNNAKTVWDENIYLSGNVAELGKWDENNAIGELYNNVLYKYSTWYYDVSLPAGTNIEFKGLKKKGSQVIWEGGQNHTYKVPDKNSVVTIDWQN